MRTLGTRPSNCFSYMYYGAKVKDEHGQDKQERAASSIEMQFAHKKESSNVNSPSQQLHPRAGALHLQNWHHLHASLPHHHRVHAASATAAARLRGGDKHVGGFDVAVQHGLPVEKFDAFAGLLKPLAALPEQMGGLE